MFSNFPNENAWAVYKLIGGEVFDLHSADPTKYANACALRVSRALNYSGSPIPKVNGTFKGADGKNYFMSSDKLLEWMKKPENFGNADIFMKGKVDESKLDGRQGIYIMQPTSPREFGALGHATLYDRFGCLDNCHISDAYTIYFWELK
jgi:hypothetical protein